MLLAVLLLSAALTVSAEAQDGGPVYRVQAGDTLSTIAFAFNTTVEAITAANGIADASRINIGDALVIPGYQDVEGELSLATVEPGEDFYSLSLRYGMTPAELAALNRVVNPERIYTGQRFIILADRQPEGHALVDIPVGAGYMEAALRADVNIWALQNLDRTEPRLWAAQNERLLAGGEDTFFRFLPDGLESLELNRDTLVQGAVVVVRAAVDEGLDLQGELAGYPLHFFPFGDGLVALQGISALQETGVADLALDMVDPASGEVVSRMVEAIRLYEGEFGFEYVNGVPPETIDPAVTVPEDTFVDELTAQASAERLWNGTFDYPSRYYIDSFIALFGTRRSYNNGAYLGYHTGLDMYGNDVPIYAPADGVVVYAGDLTVRGGTTFIDHGWGVMTGYYHQAEILVEEGQTVRRGDMIGVVGATGRVTGPHLHWEFRVGGVPVNPLDWVTNEYP